MGQQSRTGRLKNAEETPIGFHGCVECGRTIRWALSICRMCMDDGYGRTRLMSERAGNEQFDWIIKLTELRTGKRYKFRRADAHGWLVPPPTEGESAA